MARYFSRSLLKALRARWEVFEYFLNTGKGVQQGSIQGPIRSYLSQVSVHTHSAQGDPQLHSQTLSFIFSFFFGREGNGYISLEGSWSVYVCGCVCAYLQAALLLFNDTPTPFFPLLFL